MRRWIDNSPVTVGIVLVVVGFLLVALGWNGAAGLDHVSGQIPYVISGGVAGLALVGSGLCVIAIQSMRRDNADLLERLDELTEAVRDLNGATAVAATGPMAVPDGPLVIAGRSTYHLPSCRLVEGRTDSHPLTPEAAAERGLNPCRICKPQAA